MDTNERMDLVKDMEVAPDVILASSDGAAAVKEREPSARKQAFKLVAIMAAAVLMTALTTGFAYAANGGFNTLTVTVGEDGVVRYSTDDGQTWSEEAPEGAAVTIVSTADGVAGTVSISQEGVVSQGPPSIELPAGEEAVLVTRNTFSASGEEVQYSTDGGKTWSSEPPAGTQTQTQTDADGTVTTITTTASPSGTASSAAPLTPPSTR